jgi:arylsulfatase B
LIVLHPQQKPHIVVAILDDVGWNDLGYQSRDLSFVTPYMDSLAADGVKLNNFYTQPICTPARGEPEKGSGDLDGGLRGVMVSS